MNYTVRPINDGAALRAVIGSPQVVQVQAPVPTVTVHHTTTYKVTQKDLVKILPAPFALPDNAEAWILEANFSWSDGGFGFVEMGEIKPGRVIKLYSVTITTPFNDPATMVEIGWDGLPNAIMGPGENNPWREGLFAIDADIEITETHLLKVFVNTVATVGQGKATVIYLKP